MTLFQLYKELEKIALKQPNIRTVTYNDIYRAMNGNPHVVYGVFHIMQTIHRQDDEFDYYGLRLFYCDRLKDDLDSNVLQIQSIAKDTLSNIIKTFCEENDASYEEIEFTPWTEKFLDLDAGMYATIEFEIPLDNTCVEDF